MARASQRSDNRRTVKRHPDEIACRECGATFNLAFQEYYDNRCPDCVDE